MVYELVNGSTPFQGANVLLLAEAHWKAAPPALQPRMAVPPGFESWVMRLLEKQPARRFQRAADAAWSLASLGDPLETPIFGEPVPQLEPLRRPGRAAQLAEDRTEAKTEVATRVQGPAGWRRCTCPPDRPRQRRRGPRRAMPRR
jgi:serine/threonine protein kinase